jgi:hypothetical protein
MFVVHEASASTRSILPVGLWVPLDHATSKNDIPNWPECRGSRPAADHHESRACGPGEADLRTLSKWILLFSPPPLR